MLRTLITDEGSQRLLKHLKLVTVSASVYKPQSSQHILTSITDRQVCIGANHSAEPSKDSIQHRMLKVDGITPFQCVKLPPLMSWPVETLLHHVQQVSMPLGVSHHWCIVSSIHLSTTQLNNTADVCSYTCVYTYRASNCKDFHATCRHTGCCLLCVSSYGSLLFIEESKYTMIDHSRTHNCTQLS